MNAVAVRFGENLLDCRRRAGLSQEEISFRASIHRTEISQLERGLRVPRIDTLLKLMGSLDASAEDLLGGITWGPGKVHQGGFAVSSR